jgi:hypothetical protein
MFRRILVLLAAVVAGASVVASPAGAISGGSPVPAGQWAFVVRVNVDGVRGCSGVLVAAQYILTADTCFVEGGEQLQKGPPARPTTVMVGGRTLSVVQVIPHTSRHVVLAKLSLRVLDVAPALVSGTAPVVGNAAQAAGYGRTGTDWVPDRSSGAAVTVTGVGAEGFSWSGSASACQGDAGGPVFRTGGGQPEIIGITIASGQGGCLDKVGGTSGASAVRIDDLRDWITTTTADIGRNFNLFYSSAEGFPGYDLADPADQVVPFDYDSSGKLDHLVLYRPGAQLISILGSGGGAWTTVFSSTTGIGGYDLKSAADRIVAFDYNHSGKLDHLLLYRPGSRVAYVLKHGTGNTFTPVFMSTTGIGGYDLADVRDQVIAYDYGSSGKLDHLLVYRPGAGFVSIIGHGTGNSFSKVFASTTGIGGFDAKAEADRIVAFDYEHSGKLDHLVLYRPGSRIAFVVKHGAGNTFTAVFAGTDGIGGYDLARPEDQLLAFDYDYSGKLDHLVLYRPGSSIVFILAHQAGNSFVRLPVSGPYPWISGGFDLGSGADRMVAFDERHSGGPNYLVLYRPGGKQASTMGRPDLRQGNLPFARTVAAVEDSVVERFNYPGAAQILAEHGLRVFRGDGHILFVTSRHFEDGQCEAGQIQVEQHFEDPPFGVWYCFRTIGTQGYLTLEVPGTSAVRGGNTPLTATAHLPGGPDQTYSVPPNSFVPIEPGDGSEFPQAVLVELRTNA